MDYCLITDFRTDLILSCDKNIFGYLGTTGLLWAESDREGKENLYS